MSEPICCNHNCREGRDCPARNQSLYAPLRASELEGQACECALPSIVDDPKPTGWNWQAIAYFAVVALVLIWTALMITR